MMAVEKEIKQETSQQTRGRAILLLLLVFFLVPSVVVMLMIKYDWKPKGSSYGELVQPPVALVNAGDQTTSLWLDKWHVVYMDAQCAAGCVEKLRALRNLHVSMYKNMLRVKLVLVTKQKNVEDLKAQFPELIVVNDALEVEKTTKAFAIDQAEPFSAGHLYFVDPLGFLVMRFSPEIPLAEVRSDLVKLLKFAWAG